VHVWRVLDRLRPPRAEARRSAGGGRAADFRRAVYLIRHRDRVVSRDDLLSEVCGGRVVSESTLSSRINSARAAIGNNGDKQHWIRAIPRQGFRFVGQVDEDRGPIGRAEKFVADAAGSEITASGGVEASPLAYALPDRPSVAVLPFDADPNVRQGTEQMSGGEGTAH